MATLIHTNAAGGELWQGGLRDLMYSERYDVIVLCADEIQADEHTVKAYGDRLRLILAPNDDSGNEFTTDQALIAVRAARETAKEHKAGKRVLVSCAQGRNRSGLVMALTLHEVTGISGRDAIQRVRSKVPNALMNEQFVKFLLTMKASG